MSPRVREPIAERRAREAAKREARWEDIDTMLARGDNPDKIARALGVGKSTISKQARKWGNARLAKLFQPKYSEKSREERERRYAKRREERAA